ncbi:MAG: PEGA domain-containing protein [bacterium]
MKIEKFLLWTVTFALVIAGFSGAGLAQENSQPQRIIVEPKLPFKVNVWVDKGFGSTYRVGESLIVYFESSRDCYLTLFDFTPDGKVRQIFPNRYRRDNFIRANKVYAIPGERDSFEFRVAPPPGEETIKAVATVSPWWFTRETSDYQEAFPVVSKSAQEFSSKFKQRIRPIPRPKRAESSCTFYVSGWERYGRGKVRVTSEPSHASVYLDGKYRGTTPLTIRRVSVGEHRLRVAKEGYNDWSKTIFVERGQTSYVFAQLEPSYHYRRGSIRLSSQPSYAKVFIDGVDKGRTPVTVRGLKAGWHELAVIKEDYRIYVKDMYVDRGERVYLEAELEKLKY